MTTTPIAEGPNDVTVMRQEFDDSEERYLRETLAMLQESYAKAAKPYIDRLVAIRSLRTPQMFMTVEQAQELGILPHNDGAKGRR